MGKIFHAAPDVCTRASMLGQQFNYCPNIAAKYAYFFHF